MLFFSWKKEKEIFTSPALLLEIEVQLLPNLLVYLISEVGKVQNILQPREQILPLVCKQGPFCSLEGSLLKELHSGGGSWGRAEFTQGTKQENKKENKNDIGSFFVYPQTQQDIKQLRFRQSTSRITYCKFAVTLGLAIHLPMNSPIYYHHKFVSF